MPREIGAAMSRASNDEYSVPQMNGRAPKSCATGSQMSVTQNPSPNSRIERIDSRNSTTPIAADENQNERGKRARSDLEPEIAPRAGHEAHHCTLIRLSCSSSIGTSASGSGA